jgi:hypothetical protein
MYEIFRPVAKVKSVIERKSDFLPTPGQSFSATPDLLAFRENPGWR